MNPNARTKPTELACSQEGATQPRDTEGPLSLASQDLDKRVPSEGEWAAGEAGISYLQLATLRLSGRFSSSTIPVPLFARRNLINARKRTNSMDRGTAASLRIKTRSTRQIRVWCSKDSGWEPIFPRGWNKVEGEAEEGVVVSSVSACGRWGGCGQSRGRMGWDTDGTDRTIPSIVVSIYAGVSTEALKPRSSNLPVRLKLLSSYPRPSTRVGVFWTLVDRSLLAVEFQTLEPVTELAGQIQAMHNNRSPRKLWGRMVSGRIKQGGST
ncbi:hypothetical protein G5I_13543 [Acromyrmex echinatior]|uniref:Uncharacterized protein n=1 Tax=Acromyrmex echinatior TaxID=103372 RepID=F4X5B5_ACREC|nr:hypothetical protein G5I_13543 [Acromyrmex echinatior]